MRGRASLSEAAAPRTIETIDANSKTRGDGLHRGAQRRRQQVWMTNGRRRGHDALFSRLRGEGVERPDVLDASTRPTSLGPEGRARFGARSRSPWASARSGRPGESVERGPSNRRRDAQAGAADSRRSSPSLTGQSPDGFHRRDESRGARGSRDGAGDVQKDRDRRFPGGGAATRDTRR